ncbi:synemin [Rhinophrynus dorsalis]
MLQIRRGFGDEKSQLQELNHRLDQYLSRVRQLETENQMLVEEIHRLHLERGSEWAQKYHSEICELRSKVEELTVQKCEAEIQRENLWHELQSLQELLTQVRSMRLSIDQQIAIYKQDLQQAKSSLASLEELYCRLQQECQMLYGSQQEALVALREQSFKVPLQIAMQETVRPSLSLQDIQTFSLELSESWKDAFLVYQKKIEEMESSLKLSKENHQGMEEEVREQRLLVVELCKEYEELLKIRKALEEELLRMKEKYSQEVQEYQIMIEELEQERETITFTITERLRDYHELMQVKSGLSLEVAAYRALLEAESKKGKVILTEYPVKNRTAGSVASSFGQSTRYSGIKWGEERKQFPVSRSNEETRRTALSSNIHEFQELTIPQTQIKSRSIDKGRTGSSYVSRVHEQISHEKIGGLNVGLSSRYTLLKNKDFPQNTYPTDHATLVRPYSLRQSTLVNQQVKQEKVSNLKPSIISKARQEESRKGQGDIRIDDKTKGTSSLKSFETEVVEERKESTKPIEKEKPVLESNAKNISIDVQIRTQDRIYVTETTEKEGIKEPKMQELPVKKERKKREQAKKKKEELEKSEAENIDTVTGENVEISEAVHVNKSSVLGEMPKDDQVMFDIPVQFQMRTKDDSQQKSNEKNTEESQITRNSDQIHVPEESTLIKHLEECTQSKNEEGREPTRKEESEVVITASEPFAERELVADILRHFGQTSVLDDANVTYVERKQQGSDGSMKTEIFVQSKTQEDMDFFDEPDLADLWNRTSNQRVQENITGAAEDVAEEVQNIKVTKTNLGEVKGADVQDWIGNVIETGLKGRSGMSVNVEIIEETIGTFESEKAEISTPFHVEEAEDNCQATKATNAEEDLHVSKEAEDLQSKMQPSEVPSHVEEVTEAEDIDEETNYFVSIPEDIPAPQDEEEETLRGQIHIEEESHVKYSWQDEFLQGSQGRKTLSEFVKFAGTNEPDTIDHGTLEDSSINKLELKEPKEEPHVETVVIEKEIKIPHDFQSSIMGLLSKDTEDPQQQLKGALECLQGSLPQDIVDDLATLAGEQQAQTSSLAVDIKKVDQTVDSGMVTIVAEINLSQTVDADKLDTLKLIEKDTREEVPLLLSATNSSEGAAALLDSTEQETFRSEYGNNQESYSSITKGTNNGAECYSSEEIIQSRPVTTSVHLSPTGELSHQPISSDVSRFIKHIQLQTTEHISHVQPIPDTTEQGQAEDLSPSDINRSVHHIKLGPKEIISNEKIVLEGPISEALKLDIIKDIEDSSDQNKYIRHIKISPTESYPKEQIIFEGPIFKNVGTSGTTGELSIKEMYTDNVNETNNQTIHLGFEELKTDNQENRNQISYQTEAVAGASKTVSHFILNSGETQLTKEIIFEGSIPKLQEFTRQLHPEEDTLEENSGPVEHNIGSQKIHVAKQIKYQGFVSEPYQLADTGDHIEKEDQSNISTSVHHIKLSPNKEQIVFEGPISANVCIGREEDKPYLEEANRSIAHIQLGAKEIHTSQRIIFEGPVSETYESSDIQVSSPSGDSSESERSIKHIKLGPTEKSFTFQMDITKVATKYQGDRGDQEPRMVITSPTYSELTDDLEVTESGYGEEEISGTQYEAEIQSPHQHIIDTSEFDNTVQLQRIVHQSSTLSEDKKVANVYLDEEDEPDIDYLRRSF